jgi:hypothetical protein
VKTSDWDDPSIRAIGRRYAAEAYDLASELHHYGADAAELLKPQHDPTRPRDVAIPAMFADVFDGGSAHAAANGIMVSPRRRPPSNYGSKASLQTDSIRVPRRSFTVLSLLAPPM